MDTAGLVKNRNEFMKISRILSVAAATAALISTGLSANYDDIIEKGYRWVAVDGPYACPTKNDLQQITKNRTDETESPHG